jgi:HAMP domain-containing protein
MKKIIIGVFALFLLFSFISCDFFVKSWGSGMQRDLEKALKKESAKDLAKLTKDPNYVGDPEAARFLLNALSDKTKDEIESLSLNEKEDILALALTATIPMDAISEVLKAAENGEEGSGEELFNALMDSITDFDTTVIQNVLNDSKTQSEASPDTLASASAALLAQVLKRESESLDFEDLGNLFDDDDDDNDGVDISPESKADIEAVKAVLDLFDEGGKRSDEELTLFGMSLEVLFGGDE